MASLAIDISDDHDYLHLPPEEEEGGRVGALAAGGDGGGGGGGEQVFAVGLPREVQRYSFEGTQQLAGAGDDPEFVAAQEEEEEEEEEEAFTVALLREVLLRCFAGIQQFGAAIVANMANIISSMAGGDEKEDNEDEEEEEEDEEDYDEENGEEDESDEEDEEEDGEDEDEEDREEAIAALREVLRYHFGVLLAALETVEPPVDGSDCPICLDGDVVAGAWKKTPCGHSFHGRCVERWLEAKRSCPMCRVRC